VVSTQRAALIGSLVAVLAVAAAWLLPSWRRRVQLRALEAAGVVAVMVAAAVAAGLARGPRGILSAPVDAFTGAGKVDTLVSRWDQWREATALALERPIVGQGLGYEYVVALPSLDEVRVTNLAHSVPIDLFLRAGVVGVLLALAALTITFVLGAGVLRRAADDRIAALALGCLAVLSSLAAKGMLESILEKYRLMTMLGIVLGIAMSTLLAAMRPRAPARDEVPERTSRIRARRGARRPPDGDQGRAQKFQWEPAARMSANSACAIGPRPSRS